jgi:hypothetical protein
MIRTVIVIILFLVLLVAFGCQKEKPALIDPCELSKPVKADFWIGVKLNADPCGPSNYEIFEINYDTLGSGASLYFTAEVGCYDELEWIIGSDPTHRFGEQIFVNFSPQDVIGQTISIALIAKKRPNKLCNPDDDGVDTIIKNIFFDPSPKTYYGKFLGYNLDENPTDTFTVWIKGYTQNQLPRHADIVGLPKGSNNYQGVDYPIFEYNSNQNRINFCNTRTVDGGLWDHPEVFCPHTRGHIIYSINFDTITINYHYAADVTLPNEGSNRIFKTFKGVRI